MNTHALLRRLYQNGSRVSLTEAGNLLLRGRPVDGDLQDEIKAAKPELIEVLTETRIGDTDDGYWHPRRFVPPPCCEREQDCARYGWCPEALQGQHYCSEAVVRYQTLLELIEDLERAGATLVAMPNDTLRFEGNQPSDDLHARVIVATDTVLAAATLAARLNHGQALCEAATDAERDRLEVHWTKLEREYLGLIFSPLEPRDEGPPDEGRLGSQRHLRYRRSDPVALVPLWSATCPTIRRETSVRIESH